jgi:ABC-type uncharacterized transport system permease subunit
MYMGVNTRPYLLAAFVISGMYAGLAGGLLPDGPNPGAAHLQTHACRCQVLDAIIA